MRLNDSEIGLFNAVIVIAAGKSRAVYYFIAVFFFFVVLCTFLTRRHRGRNACDETNPVGFRFVFSNRSPRSAQRRVHRAHAKTAEERVAVGAHAKPPRPT